MMASWRITEE
uniref:Uncharacterized protein n=1 Tax=Anguilla anguilla TaxID=7936 RepID=A0A0E9SPP2_ANGAN